MPDVDIGIGHGLAVGNIDELQLQEERNTGLVLAVVLADGHATKGQSSFMMRSHKVKVYLSSQ